MDSDEVHPVTRAAGWMPAVERELAAELAAARAGELAVIAEDTVRAGGKRLRPLLVLAAAAPGDPAAARRAVAAAAGVELLHTATLVHDDLLDGATERRGAPTVVQAHGPAAALQAGDLLLARAFTATARSGAPAAVAILGEAAAELTRGESDQAAQAFDLGVGEQEYLARCRRKTAALFTAAVRIGAVVGGHDAAATRALVEYAEALGVAFQILDDVLDLTATAAETGKTRGTDLRDGTVTLPMILAMQVDHGLRGEIAEAVGSDDVEDLCDLLAAHPGTGLARAHAQAHLRQARRALAGLAARVDVATFEGVADAVAARLAATHVRALAA